MLGTLVNAAAILVGGSFGLLMNKKMPEKFKEIYFQAVGLFTIAIGVTMVYQMKDILIVISSLAIGSLLGEWIDIEKLTEKMGEFFKRKLRIGNEKFTDGLITSFLLFCTGSMTILGAIQEGTGVSSDLLFTKSIMDGFSAILLASAFGIGVIFSIVPLLIFQGGISLIAFLASSFFSEAIIAGISSLGGIMLIGLGITILEIKKLRIINMLPSLIIIIIFLLIFQ